MVSDAPINEISGDFSAGRANGVYTCDLADKCTNTCMAVAGGTHNNDENVSSPCLDGIIWKLTITVES